MQFGLGARHLLDIRTPWRWLFVGFLATTGCGEEIFRKQLRKAEGARAELGGK